jgi:hypothetical protein
MTKHENTRGVPLPRGWSRHVNSATLSVIAYTRSWTINDRIAQVRLKTENDPLR